MEEYNGCSVPQYTAYPLPHRLTHVDSELIHCCWIFVGLIIKYEALYFRMRSMEVNSRESVLEQAKERGFELSSDGTKWIPINSSSVKPPAPFGRKKNPKILMIGMLISSLLLTVFAIFGSSWISLETNNQQIHFGLDALNGDIEPYSDSTKLDYKYERAIMTTFNAFYAGVVIKIGLWLGVLFGFTKSIFIILEKDELEPSYEIPHIALRFSVLMGIMWGFAIGIFSIWGLYIGSEMGSFSHFGIHYWMALAGGALAYLVSFMTKSVDSS